MRFPFVRPLLPPPSKWVEELNLSYDQKYFTNFGPVEQRFTQALGAKFAAPGTICVLCNNATVGLTAALIASGVTGPVVVPAFTFPATVQAVLTARLPAVVCDVDPDSWELSADSVEAALTVMPDIAAIMPVRVFGFVRPNAKLLALAASRQLAVVFDSAAALGKSEIDCVQDERFLAEVFSLHATKSFGIGEGGAIFLDSRREAAVKKVLNFGLNPDRTFDFGLNGKMSDFQAAVGLATLGMIDALVDARAAMCRQYDEMLDRYRSVRRPTAPGPCPQTNYPVLLPPEAPIDDICARAAERGLQLRRYYFPSIATAQIPGLIKPFATPVADSLSSRMICLPVYSDSSPSECEEIIRIIEMLFEEFGVS